MKTESSLNTAQVPEAPLAAAHQGQLVIVSDVHLRRLDDERGQGLLQLIGSLGAGVECLVLNGDVFDFCFGGSDYFRRKFAGLGAALTALARRGTRVVFVEGNHEFHMREMGWDGVEMVIERDVVVTLSSGERVKISHGDLLKGDKLYAAFRALIKSRVARFFARFLPGSWLDAYAMRHASLSRAQDKYRTLDHGRILACFERWALEGDFEHAVIGHFHVPYAERRRDGGGTMLCVESWEQRPSALVRVGGRWLRAVAR